MTSITVSRAVIQLGEIDLDVFRLFTGGYQLSAEGTSRAIGKPRNGMLRFLQSNSPQALPYKDFRGYTMQVENEHTQIKGVPFELAVAYWTKEALAGNLEAVALLAACAVEALERRADRAFGVERTEEERNQRLVENMALWREARDYTRESHIAFAAAVKQKGHPGGLAHDLMTVIIFGEDAATARVKELVDPDSDPSIGLNHQEEAEKLLILGHAKFKYAQLTKKDEPWQQQIARAVHLVTPK